MDKNPKKIFLTNDQVIEKIKIEKLYFSHGKNDIFKNSQIEIRKNRICGIFGPLRVKSEDRLGRFHILANIWKRPNRTSDFTRRGPQIPHIGYF